MTSPSSLSMLLASGNDPDIALSAPGGRPLTYAVLRSLVDRTVRTLNAAGVGRGSRVAIVLPNGPEMACALIAVATCATACPLNPGSRKEEFDFYLHDLRAHALLIERGSTSPAIAAARSLGIQILELIQTGEGSGAFTLDMPANRTRLPVDRRGIAEGHDAAIMLHTSGTTAKPKLVPLTHVNLCSAAIEIRETLKLTVPDRALNVMPLFHVHGLVAGLLAPLAAGSSVSCAPGFNPLSFFAWMKEWRPTWYTAVPTMHQMLLPRAAQIRMLAHEHPLRFLRSSSAPMTGRTIAELEAAFDAPLIEAYGMTEAAHQIASNPLPPGKRKPGTVGRATGIEIEIIDPSGQRLPAHMEGEVVIRGTSVTPGYLCNPEANADCFVDSWFRTGDQGWIDEDGYLCITGRLKEIINRAGEKISPREIDEVLMDHPMVAQAITFAIPDDLLGEDVGAVVVPLSQTEVNERALREFLAQRLAAHKVPRRIVVAAEIPKGPTGKLQRMGLAKKLGLA